MSLYRVTGKFRYREHDPGTTFEARLDKRAEARALARGNIEILERSTPTIRPGSWRLPAGWHPTQSVQEE